jgi:16S rRNA pseudouridine516 synthase
MKLDRFLGKMDSLGRTAAHHLIANKRVHVDGVLAEGGQVEVSRFSHVQVDGETVQAPAPAAYLILNKPAGYLSATKDPEHPTVLELINHPCREELHIVGRLDRSSTGLLLLTNDGRWSKRIMNPDAKVAKVYEITTAEPIAAGAEEAFAQGFWFAKEGITTQPAVLVRQSQNQARVTLMEGKRHQLKRMFARIGNEVKSLHRIQVGALVLPEDLPLGQWRELTPVERSEALKLEGEVLLPLSSPLMR